MPKAKKKKQKTSIKATKAKEQLSMNIRNMSLMVMGEIASGSRNKKIKHSVEGSVGSLIFAFDGIMKPKGRKLFGPLKDGYKSVEEWMETNGAEGSIELAKVVMGDVVIAQLRPEKFVPEKECEGDSFDLKDDVLDKLVGLQTNEDDVLMCLFFENGKACSTGGYVKRTESLLTEIPFFRYLLSELHSLFEIKSLWMRTSEEGTHRKHSDTFRNNATHRGILSINCVQKKMYFER